MATINDFLKKIDITDLSEYVDTHGILTHYSKGEILVGEGRHCRYIGIVKSGYFKFVAYNSKGQEIVTGFSFVGEVVSDFVRGFLFGQTCLTTIVAGCDAEILLATIDELRSYLQERNPGFIAHSSSILLQKAYQRYLDVLVKSPAERYRELVSRYPNLIGLLSVQEMASFLGVSRRQLHRIREAETEKAD